MKMKPKKQGGNNPAVTLWQNVLLNAEIITLAKKFRKEFGVPEKGFTSYEKFKKWQEELIKKEGDDKKRINNFNAFAEEAKNIVSYRGTLSDLAFRKILIDFYYFNEVDHEILNDTKYSELGVDILIDNTGFAGKNIEDGVYIKIGPHTPIQTIKQYIQDKKSLIRSAQELFAKSRKIPKPGKQKWQKNFERDDRIMSLNELSNKELRPLTPDLRPNAYKEERIAEIMTNLGWQGVNSGVVKTVIQRRRKMIKALK